VAKIDLNNLIRPKQVNNPYNVPTKLVDTELPVYTDLHLDLKIKQNIGLGNAPVTSNDLYVDNDVEAIKNSLRNIFNTRKGQKVLNPEFGASLEQYLFEPINEVYAKAIGDEITENISSFEPRVQVLRLQITPKPDDNQYYIMLVYRFLEIKKENILNIIAKQGGEILI
jgi:phage baseplate assembly protein W